MTLGSSDLQSDSDLDSIRNSCDVFNEYPAFPSHSKKLNWFSIFTGRPFNVKNEISPCSCLFAKLASHCCDNNNDHCKLMFFPPAPGQQQDSITRRTQPVRTYRRSRYYTRWIFILSLIFYRSTVNTYQDSDLEFVKTFTRPNFQAKEFYTLKLRKSRLFSPAINS